MTTPLQSKDHPHLLVHHRTQGGGAEGVHLREQAAGFERHGYSLSVFSIYGESLAEPKVVASDNSQRQGIRAKLKTLAQSAPPALFELLEVSYNFAVLIPLWLKIRKNTPDLIYERYSLFCFVGVLLAKFSNVPIVLEVNDSAAVDRVRTLYFRKLASFLEEKIFRRASNLVFVSTEFKNICESAYGEFPKAIVNPNAINPDHFQLDKYDKQQTKDEFRLGQGPVFGYVGAFVYWHGVPEFLRELLPTLAELSDETSNFAPHFLMVGDGVTRQESEDLVKAANCEKYFTFTGSVAHAEIPKHLAAMDVGFIPNSNVYGSPMKLFEYMAMGVPSICPKYPPIQEVLSDGETGWLFERNDYAQAVELVQRLARDPEEVKRVARNCRVHVLQNHTWQKNAENTLRSIS